MFPKQSLRRGVLTVLVKRGLWSVRETVRATWSPFVAAIYGTWWGSRSSRLRQMVPFSISDSKTPWFWHNSSLNQLWPLRIYPTPSEFTHPIPFPLSIFFCHHEGPYKRWEFLNPCIFRLRSTPSSSCLVKQIGFRGLWTFLIFFLKFLLTSKTSVLTKICLVAR